MPEMENLRNRFPTLISMVLENVDDQSLVTFKETNREMLDFINEERFYWLRILRKYNGSFVEFSKSWRMVIEKNPVEIVREIAVTVEKFFNDPRIKRDPRNTKQWAPLHVAAASGNLSIFQYIFLKTNNEYPIGTQSPVAALNLAAQEGNLEICQFILSNTSVDRNTCDVYGMLPIHRAARCGHLEICKVLIGELDNKNPSNVRGWTPLHLAAHNGKMEICKLLIGELDNKNPSNDRGRTPLHLAANDGHMEVCKLLIGVLENKNPSDLRGWTPLHDAAENGHMEVCKLIVSSNIENKNPVSNDGLTPHQLMSKFSKDLFLNF